jgi:hypothetical protein
MIKKLWRYFKNKRSRNNAFLISSSSIKSKPSEVFVLRQGLLYVLDDKIVHLTFEGDGVELGHSAFERNFTFLAYLIFVGCFLFIPIYAFAKGAWYLGIPYSLLLLPVAFFYLKNLRASATPMILKEEVKNVTIKNTLIPILEIKTHEGEVFRISIGNAFYIRKSEKKRLKETLVEKGYIN